MQFLFTACVLNLPCLFHSKLSSDPLLFVVRIKPTENTKAYKFGNFITLNVTQLFAFKYPALMMRRWFGSSITLKDLE
jgi:hypothetical protein